MAKMCISATAAADMEKAAATKADAMVTVTGAAVMARAITRAAAATGKKTNSRECGFYSRLYLQRF